MQPAVALIGDGKHDKDEDESANELEWEMRYGFIQDEGGHSHHRKNNWLMTRRRANPKILPISDTDKKKRGGRGGRTDRVRGEETGTFQRKLTVPALEDVDCSRVIGENNE